MGEHVGELLHMRSTEEESTMDRTNAGFEGIAQMLLEQKKLMDALEGENRELRRQLADLRRGVGIAVVVEGKTIQLTTEQGTPAPQMSSAAQAALQSLQSLQSLQNAQGLSSANGTQSATNNNYTQNGRQTGPQAVPAGSSNGDKRENGNMRGPLADSFVL